MMAMNTDDDPLQEYHISNFNPRYVKSALFSGIVLAHWDNIMGPMITKIWRGNDNVDISKEIINYVANHTLSGELCRQTDKNTIDPKFYVLSDLGCIFSAVIFNGHSKTGSTITSLSFIMAYKDMRKYLSLQDFMLRQVKLIVLKYRVLQQKNLNTAVKYFSSYLNSFLKVLDSLEELSIPSSLCINETIFGEGDEAHDFQLLDSAFLMRCLTSHLQTCGCTVVIGKSAIKTNLLLRTLALFSSANERACSRYACENDQYLFTKDLWLQGIVYNDDEDIAFNSKNILLNSYPVTLINVDTKNIQQTPQLDKHDVIRKNFITLELSMLLQGENAPVYPFLDLFTEDIGDISILVQKFISNIFSGPIKCTVRKNYIEHFLKLLKQKAATLVSYVDARSNSGQESLNVHHVYKVKQDLSLTSEPDFRIVLAQAEKIKPGFAAYLIGDLLRRDAEYQAVLEDFK